MNTNPISAVANPTADSARISNDQNAKTDLFRHTALKLVEIAITACASRSRIIGSANELAQNSRPAKTIEMNMNVTLDIGNATVATASSGDATISITIDIMMSMSRNTMLNNIESINTCPISSIAFLRS